MAKNIYQIGTEAEEALTAQATAIPTDETLTLDAETEEVTIQVTGIPPDVSVTVQPTITGVGSWADASGTTALPGDVTLGKTFLDKNGNMVEGTSTNIPYEGDYEVTPSADTQVLLTEGFVMAQNVTVNPIPSNYGRITRDGMKLTVS